MPEAMELRFLRPDCKGKRPAAGTLPALLKVRARQYCNCGPTGYHSASPSHEETRLDFRRSLLRLACAAVAGANGRSERHFSARVHDLAAGRETRARQSIQSGPGKISLGWNPDRRLAEKPFRLAAGDR